ncbi:MAG: asparagine synthase (glutamine-hydrolyzing) [Proteobacteria bacterium]|nr:asparagine synthase (glutamine-hydrolyzing) [Pseudomonadota bacterium]
MCGILGALRADRNAVDAAAAARALDTLSHRGPDARGEWHDAAAGLWLGHRRLAVIDLTPTGAQPMCSRDGRYVLVFNGEIYNFRSLRAELERDGVALRGHSDTEVLLETIARDGLAACLPRLNGMFALALWDHQTETLHLARDRFGEKPLYYGVLDGALLFGSELKALVCLHGRTPALDRDALAAYFRRNYIPEPASIFDGVAKLPAGHVLSIARAALPTLPTSRAYWSLADEIERAAPGASSMSDAQAVSAVHDTLARAVEMRMVADVPLGALLSGGLDSSLMVALMQRASSRPVRTFSIGFAEAGYDEAPHARAVAQHLGTEHTEQCISAAEAQAVIPRLADIYDEPFADSSQIPSVLVAALARRSVTTAITGDGGDELFGGYLRYGLALDTWRRLRALPAPLRALLIKTAGGIAPAHWDRVLLGLAPLLPARLRFGAPGDRLHKLARLAAASDLAAMHAAAAELGSGLELVLGTQGKRWSTKFVAPAALDDAGAMMFADALDYLPGDILTKVDRAAMAASLETRVPFLDNEVVALAWRLPPTMKLRGGQSKWVLREVLSRYVPPALTERAKAGFAVPLDAWLRGPLRAWAGDLLSESRLRAAALLDARTVQRLWQEHLSGRRNHQHVLWALLMFECWRARWGGMS